MCSYLSIDFMVKFVHEVTTGPPFLGAFLRIQWNDPLIHIKPFVQTKLQCFP